MRVFLVEDAPLLRERLIALIASVGASTVGHAEGAQEAIDGILASGPDAVVLDLHLKEGNGFDVLRAVRKAAPAIVFFVLTNHPHEGYRASAERLGARGRDVPRSASGQRLVRPSADRRYQCKSHDCHAPRVRGSPRDLLFNCHNAAT